MARCKFLVALVFLGLMATASAHAYDWIVGESGIALQWQPNCQITRSQGQGQQNQCNPVSNPITLAGSTVTVYLAPASSVSSGNVGSCATNPSCETRSASIQTVTQNANCIDPTGVCAVYVMTTTDFLTPGNWYIEFQATYSNGLRKAQIVSKSVGPALN